MPKLSVIERGVLVEEREVELKFKIEQEFLNSGVENE